MAKLSIDSLWKPKSKTAQASSAELQADIRGWEEKRSALLEEHEKLSKGKAAALETGGPAALKDIQLKIRDIASDLEICDLSLEGLNKRLEETVTRESDEKLKTAAKQAEIDSKAQFELRNKFVKLAIETANVRKDYFATKRKVDDFRQMVHKAGRDDLRPPADALVLAFIEKTKNAPHHPIDDNALFQGLQLAEHFGLLVKKLGIEA